MLWKICSGLFKILLVPRR